MIEDNRYCVDILTQIKAVKSALVSIEAKILEEHLGHCVKKAFSDKNAGSAESMIKEIKEIVLRKN